MRREELQELHYIVPMDNLRSICQFGLLCHERVAGMPHRSIALQNVQALRQKLIPGGLRLHQYVNLYICARNPMLYRRLEQYESICVVRVSPAVLDIPGTVVTDQNAASDYVRFSAAPEGLNQVDRDATFADDWRHPDDQVQEWRHKSRKCAEVLVPYNVPPEYFLGVYVSGQRALTSYNQIGAALPVEVNGHMFFYRE